MPATTYADEPGAELAELIARSNSGAATHRVWTCHCPRRGYQVMATVPPPAMATFLGGL